MKQIKCFFTQWVIKLLELTQGGVEVDGVSKIKKGSNKLIDNRSTNGS